ncbi:MAG: hypothetical protein WCT39_00975 [Candidatus Margulisiibacteriota bacterium]
MSAHIKGFFSVSLLLLCVLSGAAFGDTSGTYEVYGGKRFGSSYFFAISGEVIGQAAPGVESVMVNGIPVPFDKNLNFSAKVSLPAGQKYLTISTKYKGLRFIKQYLVIRHPAAPKTFTIRVPKQEFKKIVEPPPKKITPTRKIIKAKPLATAPEPSLETPKVTVIEIEVPVIENSITTEEMRSIVKETAQKILEKEIEKMLARDVPPGVGLKIIDREIRKLVQSEAPDIIASEIRKILLERITTAEALASTRKEIALITRVRIKNALGDKAFMQTIYSSIKLEIIALLDREALWEIAKKTVEAEARKAVNAPALRKVAIEALRKEARVQPPIKILGELKAANLVAVAGNPPYDLIIELEPGKILLIKRDDGKYLGYIYLAENKLWFPLQEISAKELKDLLDTGKMPASY